MGKLELYKEGCNPVDELEYEVFHGSIQQVRYLHGVFSIISEFIAEHYRVHRVDEPYPVRRMQVLLGGLQGRLNVEGIGVSKDFESRVEGVVYKQWRRDLGRPYDYGAEKIEDTQIKMSVKIEQEARVLAKEVLSGLLDKELPKKFEVYKRKIIRDIDQFTAKTYRCMHKNAVAQCRNDIVSIQLKHKEQIEAIQEEIKMGKEETEQRMYAAVDDAVLRLHNRVCTYSVPNLLQAESTKTV